MSDATPSTYFRKNITEIASLLVAGFALTALFTGQSWWLAALLVGYLVVVPLVAVLFDDVTDWKSWWYDYVWGDDWLDELWDELRDDLLGTSSESEPEVDDDTSSNRDALETLRERYARGELTDAQFERKLEQLLETETLENAEDRQRERLHERE